jgi:predicted dehydrogenase
MRSILGKPTRRAWLKGSLATGGALAMPWIVPASALGRQEGREAASERITLGVIGFGPRCDYVLKAMLELPDVQCVALCDVRRERRDEGKKLVDGRYGNDDCQTLRDFRELLDRPDIDAVLIATGDRWHGPASILAARAGKDVYCEKPLTLTIEEGKQIRKVLDETKRVFQVGTQQRSEMGGRFLAAVALVKEGRIGKVQRVECRIGGSPVSGPIPVAEPPQGLNWEKWLGQTTLVEYRHKPNGRYGKSRCHYEFRWWYEYSGGKMTDWGAHHVDIAQWAIGMDESGPVSIEGPGAHPVPFENGHPTLDDQYNAATKFLVTCQFPNEVEMVIRHDQENGILFQGTEGEFFVSRGAIAGEPVDALKDNPIPPETVRKLYKGKTPGNHMKNFFDCIADREQPISDVHTHDRAMQTCHLANIAIRLGRKLQWDPKTEQIVGDSEAQQWQAREQRKGYEIEV